MSESEKYQNASGKIVPTGKVGQGVSIPVQNNVKEQSNKPAGFFNGLFFGGGAGAGNSGSGGNGGNGGNGDDDDFDPDEYNHEPHQPDMGDVATLAYIQHHSHKARRLHEQNKMPKRQINKKDLLSYNKPFTIQGGSNLKGEKMTVSFAKREYSIKNMS